MHNFKFKHCLIPLLIIPLLFSMGCAALKRVDTPIYSNGTNAPATGTNTEYVVSPKVLGAIAEAKTVSGFLPPPYGTILDALGAVGLAGLGIFARAKSRQSTEHLSLLNTVIAGVEMAAQTGTPVKNSIANIAAATGNSDALDSKVQAVSSVLPPLKQSGA